MIVYTRKILPKLLSLRLSFLILFIFCIFAFKNSFLNLGYFLSVVLVSLSIIVVQNVIVSSNNFQIVKYYFFGLIKFKWRFVKTDNLKLKSYGSDFGAQGEYQDTDTTGTGLGCLFSIFAGFMESEIIRKEIRLEKFSNISKVANRVDIKVDRFEYKLLQAFVGSPSNT